MTKIDTLYSATEISRRDDRQTQVLNWAKAAFASDAAHLDEAGPRVRALRFIEEATELLQAEGISRDDIVKIVDYVMLRPVGTVAGEIGGVMVTLMAYAEARGYGVASCEMVEIERINKKPVEHFRQRQREKTAEGLL